MTKQTVIRLLTGLIFLIFLCPFFQTCSDKNLLKKAIKTEVALPVEDSINSTTHSNFQTEVITLEQQDIEKENSLTESRKHHTLSGYEMALYLFKEFEIQDFSDFGFYCFLCFFVVLIISIIQFYLSFKNKFKIIYLLSLTNLLFVIFPMISFYFVGILEDVNQIKYGYYLFIINTIALLVFSKKIDGK